MGGGADGARRPRWQPGDMDSNAQHGPVVVAGFDGSIDARSALRYALDEARRRGARLRVVSIWQFPTTVAMGMVLPPDFADVSAKAAAETLRTAVEELGATDVEIEQVVTDGIPSHVLVEESRHADVLVVGSRGHGSFTGMLLGSVSQDCVHHATCPVVVMPHQPVPESGAAGQEVAPAA
jgi:nucleotide-binding universal stress UspA family protein